MASKRRAPTTGFGLFAAPVASPTIQQPNRSGAVEAELAAWIRDKRYTSMARALERGDDPVQPNGNGGVPPAANLTEAVTAATSIASLHKGAADMAMAERRAAEERAEKIAAAAGEQVEKAKEETASQFQVIMQMQQQFAQTMMEITTANLKGQIEERDRLRELELKRIDDKIQALQQQHTMALAQRDAEIQKLKEEKEELLSRATLDDVILGEIKQGRRDGLVAHLLGVTRQTDLSTDPDHIFRAGIAQVKVDEARRQLDRQDQEMRHKDETHRAMMGIWQGLADLIGQGRSVVEHMVGQPRGLERNGVPAGFDDGCGEEPSAATAAPLAPDPPPIYPGSMDEESDSHAEY